MNKKSKIFLCETLSNFSCSPLWLKILPLCVSAYPLSLREKNEYNSEEIAHKLDAMQAETQKLEMIYNKKIADLGELMGKGFAI